MPSTFLAGQAGVAVGTCVAGARPARQLRCLGARGAGDRIMRALSAETAQELRDPLRSWPGQPDDAMAAGA
jgi:hypothetical protein